MKNLLLTALLVLLCQLTYAQSSAAQPAAQPTAERGDNTILVPLTDTPENTWRQLSTVLLRRGFAFSHTDKELLTLTTYPKIMRTIGRPCWVTGAILDGKVVLRMFWTAEAAMQMSLAQQMRRGTNAAEWRELEAIAKEMGTEVQYTIWKVRDTEVN